MMSERSGVGDDGGVDEPAKRHKQRRHRKHKRGSSRRRDSDQRGANGGDTAHSASNQVAQHVVRDTPRASVTAPGLAPPPPPHVDVTGATGTRQGIVVVVVLVCVTALGVASWTMKGSRVAMVAVEGHAGVGHSGGVPAHKLSPDTVAGQWNQHEHKWRPLPNPAVDCPGPVRKRYGTVDEDEWLGVIGTLMAENPGIARFYSQDGEDMYLMHRFFGRPVADGGVFIDVGAMDGKTHSNTAALEEAMDWAGICIEPSPPNFVQLKRKRPYCDSYNVAICKEPGRTVVYGEGLGASQKPNTRLRGSVHRKGYSVACGPLSAFEKALGMDHVDLLSVDAGGGPSELTVLQSHDWTAVPVLVVIVEMQEKAEVYNNVAREYLRAQGMCRVAWGVGHSSEVFVNATRYSWPDPLRGWPLEPRRTVGDGDGWAG